MQKKLHKIFSAVFSVVICASFLTILSPFCIATEENLLNSASENNPISTSQTNQRRDIKVNDLDIEPINTQNVKKTVVPDTKQEGKKVLGLFVKAMLIVILCSLFCFLVLKFIKRFYADMFTNQQADEYEALDLSSPNTKLEALQSFLRRTK